MTDNQLDRSQDSHTYHYDSAQRFTKMERGTIGGTPNFYQGYTLDALANWSSFNNNGTTESRSHDVMNAITARGATSLSHDLNGNLTNDGNQKYIWDELNRLVEVRDSGNNIICDYYYNADNLRVEKHHAGGAKEQYYYDGATVLVETDGSQTKVREYVNGGQYIDEVILVVNGSTYNYYMSDLRFCVTGFIDSTGAVVERARYDGYGKRTLLDAAYATITTANVDQFYGYTGIRHDIESGLQYYRARYFDNILGRFINHDPLGYVDGLNLYRGYFIVGALDANGKTINSIISPINTVAGIKAKFKGATAYTGGVVYGLAIPYSTMIETDSIKETDDKKCAEVISARKIYVDVLRAFPNDLLAKIKITANGVVQVKKHEGRRWAAYVMANKVFLAPSEITGKQVIKCGKIRRYFPGEAVRVLNEYLAKTRRKAIEEFKNWNEIQQDEIGKENTYQIDQYGGFLSDPFNANTNKLMDGFSRIHPLVEPSFQGISCPSIFD